MLHPPLPALQETYACRPPRIATEHGPHSPEICIPSGIIITMQGFQHHPNASAPVLDTAPRTSPTPLAALHQSASEALSRDCIALTGHPQQMTHVRRKSPAVGRLRKPGLRSALRLAHNQGFQHHPNASAPVLDTAPRTTLSDIYACAHGRVAVRIPSACPSTGIPRSFYKYAPSILAAAEQHVQPTRVDVPGGGPATQTRPERSAFHLAYNQGFQHHPSTSAPVLDTAQRTSPAAFHPSASESLSRDRTQEHLTSDHPFCGMQRSFYKVATPSLNKRRMSNPPGWKVPGSGPATPATQTRPEIRAPPGMHHQGFQHHPNASAPVLDTALRISHTRLAAFHPSAVEAARVAFRPGSTGSRARGHDQPQWPPEGHGVGRDTSTLRAVHIVLGT